MSDGLNEWHDQPLPEDDAILAAHPMYSDDPKAHGRYMEAMRLVGAKRSKGALVMLVCWLLKERDAARKAQRS